MENVKDLYKLNEKFSILSNVEESDKTKFKSILSWAESMMELSVKEKVIKKNGKFFTPRRGEVWTCDFGENVGSEVNKIRPCLIVQNDRGNEKSPTTIVIPISHRYESQPTHVELSDEFFSQINGSISGITLAEQIKVVSKIRLGKKIGLLNSESMRKIDEAVKISLGLC